MIRKSLVAVLGLANILLSVSFQGVALLPENTKFLINENPVLVADNGSYLQELDMLNPNIFNFVFPNGDKILFISNSTHINFQLTNLYKKNNPEDIYQHSCPIELVFLKDNQPVTRGEVKTVSKRIDMDSDYELSRSLRVHHQGVVNYSNFYLSPYMYTLLSKDNNLYVAKLPSFVPKMLGRKILELSEFKQVGQAKYLSDTDNQGKRFYYRLPTANEVFFNGGITPVYEKMVGGKKFLSINSLDTNDNQKVFFEYLSGKVKLSVEQADYNLLELIFESKHGRLVIYSDNLNLDYDLHLYNNYRLKTAKLYKLSDFDLHNFSPQIINSVTKLVILWQMEYIEEEIENNE